MLSAFDGLQVASTEDGGVVVAEDPELDVTNGLLPAALLESDVTSDEAIEGLLIGKAFHQSRVLLAGGGAVVFDDGDEVVEVAPSLEAFLRRLAELGMSVEAVVSEKL